MLPRYLIYSIRKTNSHLLAAVGATILRGSMMKPLNLHPEASASCVCIGKGFGLEADSPQRTVPVERASTNWKNVA